MADPLTVLVAARDEADRIKATVADLRTAFPGATVVVADDGSRDATATFAEQAGAKVLSIQLSYTTNLDKSFGLFLGQAGQKEHVESRFDLSSPVNGLHVKIQMWNRGPRFCDCVSPPAKVTATWIAKSGKLTMTAHGPAKGLSSDCYLVSALLEDVVFEDEQGHRVTSKKETIPEVGVGWYAG